LVAWPGKRVVVGLFGSTETKFGLLGRSVVELLDRRVVAFLGRKAVVELLTAMLVL